jgi:hypothetical protein
MRADRNWRRQSLEWAIYFYIGRYTQLPIS